MKRVNQFLKQLWNDESAQGATEYILILMVVVAIAVLFKDKIKTAVDDKLKALSEEIGKFTGQ